MPNRKFWVIAILFAMVISLGIVYANVTTRVTVVNQSDIIVQVTIRNPSGGFPLNPGASRNVTINGICPIGNIRYAPHYTVRGTNTRIGGRISGGIRETGYTFSIENIP